MLSETKHLALDPCGMIASVLGQAKRKHCDNGRFISPKESFRKRHGEIAFGPLRAANTFLHFVQNDIIEIFKLTQQRYTLSV